MAKLRGGVEHLTFSTNTSVTVVPTIYYGCIVVNKTTGGVTVGIYDAIATNQGNLVDMITVTAGTNANNGVYYPNGIIMHSGIYASAIIATTASDNIVVFYGGK